MSEQHRWIMVATFSVTGEKVAELAKARLAVSASVDAPVPTVGLEMTQDQMLSVDGPGCGMCGVEWTAGYGVKCPGEMSVAPPGRLIVP